jgi:hypothetical protein
MRNNRLSFTKVHRSKWHTPDMQGGRCGRDHMVVGFTITYAISAYQH